MTQTTFSELENNTHPKWWKDPGLRRNVFHLCGLCLCPFYLGYDSALLTGLQALPAWLEFFDSPKGTHLGLITASISFPTIVSSFFSDFMSERIGRRWCIWIGSVLIILGGLLYAFSTGLPMFIAARVVTGFGGGMIKVVAVAMVHEVAHPRFRSLASAVYYSLYYSGSILAAWLTFGTLFLRGDWSWRLPCLVQILGPILVIAITITMPESPRWLVRNDKKEQALGILAKYHANGLRDDPLVQYEFREIITALDGEEKNNSTSYLDFFRSTPNRRRLIVLIAISWGQNWIGNGIISYYLSPILKTVGITDPAQITGINGGLQIFNLFLALLGSSLVERVGRRPLWLTSTAGMFASTIVIMGLSAGFATTHNKAMGTAVIPFLYIFYGFYDIAWTPLAYSYSSEILPYNLRSKGMAIFVAIQNVAAAFNQFVNPIALAAIAWKYYSVYLVIQIFYIVLIYFYFPETRHMTIEEVSVLFDKYGKRGDRVDLHEAVMSELEGKGRDTEHLERVDSAGIKKPTSV